MTSVTAKGNVVSVRGLAVKIRKVICNNRKKTFEVTTRSKALVFPYAKADPQPSRSDRIVDLYVDDELAREHTGAKSDLIRRNFTDVAARAGEGGPPVWARLPLVPGITDSVENPGSRCSCCQWSTRQASAALPPPRSD